MDIAGIRFEWHYECEMFNIMQIISRLCSLHVIVCKLARAIYLAFGCVNKPINYLSFSFTMRQREIYSKFTRRLMHNFKSEMLNVKSVLADLNADLLLKAELPI